MNVLQEILKTLRRGEAQPLIPMAKEKNQYALAVSSTVMSLLVPDRAVAGEIYVRTASIVFTRSGEAPTSTKGLQADATDIIVLDSHEKLVGFQGIRVGADATLDVEYFERATP